MSIGRRTRWAAVATAGALLLAACGSDEPDQVTSEGADPGPTVTVTDDPAAAPVDDDPPADDPDEGRPIDGDLPDPPPPNGGPTETPAGPAPGPQDPASITEDELADARARWEAAGPTSYTLTYRRVCFCPMGDDPDIVVTVADGEITEVEGEENLFGAAPSTVDDLFDELNMALDEGAASVQATFDPDTGRPLDYYIDFDFRIADEEAGVNVIDLTT